MADSGGCDERRKPWPDARLELPDQHRSQRIRRRRALLLRGSARHSVGHGPVTSAVPRWSIRELIWAVMAALWHFGTLHAGLGRSARGLTPSERRIRCLRKSRAVNSEDSGIRT